MNREKQCLGLDAAPEVRPWNDAQVHLHLLSFLRGAEPTRRLTITRQSSCLCGAGGQDLLPRLRGPAQSENARSLAKIIKICVPTFIAALLTTAKRQKQPEAH